MHLAEYCWESFYNQLIFNHEITKKSSLDLYINTLDKFCIYNLLVQFIYNIYNHQCGDFLSKPFLIRNNKHHKKLQNTLIQH